MMLIFSHSLSFSRTDTCTLFPVHSVPQNVYSWNIESVPRFPGPIELKVLFPTKHPFVLVMIAGISYEVSMAEVVVPRISWRCKRPHKFSKVPFDRTRAKLYCSIRIDVLDSHWFGIPVFDQVNILLVGIEFTNIITFFYETLPVKPFVVKGIGCEHRVFTCVTAVELLDSLCVPV